MKKTLLERAKEVPSPKKIHKINCTGREEMELSIAFFKKEISAKQFIISINDKYSTDFSESSTLTTAAQIIRAGTALGEIKLELIHL